MTHKLLFLLIGISLLSVGHAHGGRIRRVVGGQQMGIGAWPWLVSLNFKEHHDYLNLQGLDHLCGGTLINPYWVLTAAHCVHYMSGSVELERPQNWLAVLGEYNRQIDEQMEQKIPIQRIIVSPSYALMPNLTGDIALLKLQRPARINRYVKPLPVDSLRHLSDGQECKAAGWGQHTAADSTDHPQYGNGTMVPHVISLAKVSDTLCQREYAPEWPLIDSTVLCFYSADRMDTCQGDSGGPLVCPTSDGGSALTGIVSVGFGCASANYPGIYTRVASYRDWIQTAMAQNADGEREELQERQI